MVGFLGISKFIWFARKLGNRLLKVYDLLHNGVVRESFVLGEGAFHHEAQVVLIFLQQRAVIVIFNARQNQTALNPQNR